LRLKGLKSKAGGEGLELNKPLNIAKLTCLNNATKPLMVDQKKIKMSEEQGLKIIPGKEQAMSKEQKLFNSRIKKINGWKAKIQKIKDKIDLVKGQFNKELGPLESEINEVRFKLIQLFDKAYDAKMFKAKEKGKLNNLIMEVGGDLVNYFHNEELQAIYKKHEAIFEETMAQEEAKLSEEEKAQRAEEMKEMEEMGKDFIKDMIKEMTGMDINIEDLDDFDHIEKQVKEQQAKMEEEAEAAFTGSV